VDGWQFYRTLASGGVLKNVPALREIKLMSDTARRLEELARQLRPDILHAHSPVLNAIPAMRVGRRLGIPVVYEVRASWEDAAVDHGTASAGGLRYRLSRALETWALRHVDAVTTICEGLRGEIIARGIPPEKVNVIPNAVDLGAFTLDDKPDSDLRYTLGLDDAWVLGFVGSFYAYEGLEILLRAFPTIVAKVPRARVLLVGGGRQEADLKRLAAELGIANQVVFTGRVPHGEVQRYYRLIDILVYPRLSMRLTELVTPLKPLEAMAQGRLLAASDVGGHRELIRGGTTGVLFKAGDPNALTRTVLDLLNQPQKWPLMRAAARHFVETERSWSHSVARYRQVYASVLESGGKT
jgi:PEP-CTERM/exosortase A-associated glycosyltransferase